MMIPNHRNPPERRARRLHAAAGGACLLLAAVIAPMYGPGLRAQTPAVCPCSIWTPAQVPSQPSQNDAAAVEVGLKFRTTSDGFITGVRFYKGALNTGTHVGNLWTAGGSLLQTLTFSGESASGWQQALFASPVAVSANITYVVSYHTDAGFYAVDGAYFLSSGVTNGPLQALADGVDGPNGVFKYGASAFPTDSFNATNYWVDVVFDTSSAPDTTPPVVTAHTPAAGATGVPALTAVTATFSEDLNVATINGSTFVLRDAADAVVSATVIYDSVTRTATLQPTGKLAPLTAYTARVLGGASGVTDPSANALAADVTWTFTTSEPSVTDTTVADFGAGLPGAGIYLSQTADGEVILEPAVGTEFSGSTLPAGWSVATWDPNGTTLVAGGHLTTDGARVSTDAVFAPGRSLEFVATFSSDTFENVGFGVTFNDPPWAMFGTASGGGLYARTNDGAGATDTLIPGSWLGTAHRYRIDWTGSSIVYAIDGAQVASHAATIGAGLAAIASDFNVGGGSLVVDWMRLTPYATSGTFTSRVLDSGTTTAWSSATWSPVVPPGATLAMSARFGNTPTPDGTWTGFQVLPFSGTAPAQTSRYVQYMAVLTGTGADTPALQDVTFAGPPVALPAISIDDVSVIEGDSGAVNAVFTLVLSGPSVNQVTVAYAAVAGTATSGTDFTAASGTAILPAGTTSVTVSVPVVGDTLVESNETFFLNLSSPVNATIADAQGVGTIVNDDVPLLSIGDAVVTEGNSGSATAQFAVTLSQASPQTVTVGYATANGTATAPADFAAKSGTLTFAPGATAQTITVAVVGDALDEANETFAVNLSHPVNATIADAQGVGTIMDDDPPPALAINDVTVTEGNSASLNAVFTVTLSAASGQTVTVGYATANGTATAPADFTAKSGTLTFAAGATAQTITVAVVRDAIDEVNETFAVNLSNSVNATIADAQGVGTIIDNDPTPSLSVNNVSVTEGNSGTVNAVFTVTLSAASGLNVTVNYATADGTAAAGSDYTSKSGLLTFAPGTVTQTISVAVLADALDEPDETLNVNLSGATNATISDSQGVGTIVDDDPNPTLTINNVSLPEGNSRTRNFTFTLTLSAASARTATVSYATTNVTAVAGSDYTAKSGTVTFNPGTTTQTIVIEVQGDTRVEANETFFVVLTNGSNLLVVTPVAVGTILNDD
jgi:Domain of unknown function (DUF4082)/Bacterial Ig-like domain/Calx-beta domain